MTLLHRLTPLGARAALLLTIGSTPAWAQYCFGNANRLICISNSAGNPIPGIDFTVTANFDAITLITPDPDWNILVKHPATGVPLDMVGIYLAPSASNGDFGLTFGDAATPGAENLQDIDLTALGWSGASWLNSFRIDGDLTGLVQLQSLPNGVGGGVLNGFRVGGTLSGLATLGMVQGGGLVHEILGQLGIGTLLGGTFEIERDILPAGRLEVMSFLSGSVLRVGSAVGTGDVGGQLLLTGGIPAASSVYVNGALELSGVVDFANMPIAGIFSISQGGAGQVTGGGDVTGHVWLAASTGQVFSGSAEFDSVGTFGIVETELFHLDGELHILGNAGGFVGPRAGDLLTNGVIEIDGNVLASAFVGAQGAPLGGNQFGQVLVHGDVFGTVLAEATLWTNGQILVDGTTTGSLFVGDELQAGTLVSTRHLGPGGRIAVNTSLGNYNANGRILVGPLAQPFNVPVKFDGCIRVYDDAAGNGGDLNGTIFVIGCHATTDPLEICIDGAVNGQVRLLQSGCANQVTSGCTDSCN